MNDAKITRYLVSENRDYTLDEIADYIRRINEDPSQLMLGMFLKTDESHVGNIKLDSIDQTHGTANVGLLVGERQLWGQGYGTEAIEALTGHAFQKLGVKKLCAGCYRSNHGSISAFLKAGYHQEGVRASQFNFDGKRIDEILLGRAAEEAADRKNRARQSLAAVEEPSPRIAVLGMGSIGLRHAQNLKALGLDPIGYDPDPARRQLAENKGIQTSANREDTVEGAHGVIVASPNAFHLEDLAFALSHNCHVFVEKPLAHTDKGVEDLLKGADASGLIVFTGFNLRFHPCVQRAEEALRANVIGKLLWARLTCASYLPSWRPNTDYTNGYAADRVSGGVLFDNCHEIDLANHLFGQGSVIGASAQNSGTLEIDSEDCADLILRHIGGMVSVLHLDYITRPAYRVTEIIGEDGRIVMDLNARNYTRFDNSGKILEREQYDLGIDDDYVAEAKGFLDCISGRAAPPCDGWQALGVLDQVLAARQYSGLPIS